MQINGNESAQREKTGQNSNSVSNRRKRIFLHVSNPLLLLSAPLFIFKTQKGFPNQHSETLDK